MIQLFLLIWHYTWSTLCVASWQRPSIYIITYLIDFIEIQLNFMLIDNCVTQLCSFIHAWDPFLLCEPNQICNRPKRKKKRLSLKKKKKKEIKHVDLSRVIRLITHPRNTLNLVSFHFIRYLNLILIKSLWIFPISPNQKREINYSTSVLNLCYYDLSW